MIRNFSPDTLNPRERRAYAHTMIEAYRERRIPRRAAELAIEAASHTRKGMASGFQEALDHASSYKSVKGAGNAYEAGSWPFPPIGSPRIHMVFEDLLVEDAREPVAYSFDAWPVLRDELAARRYGMHAAGEGGFVAVVLDRILLPTDLKEIAEQYGWVGRHDPTHQTEFC